MLNGDTVGGTAHEIDIDGLCLGCGAFGVLGQPCTNVVCDRFELHFVPSDEPGLERDNNDPMVGRRVDEFLIVELIGKGGFGKVYRALFGHAFRQAAALKFLHLPDDERIRATMPEKFVLEGQVLRTLDHPNVVGLIAHRTDAITPYIAMEYLPDSITLREDVIRKIRSGQWYSERQVRGILVQMLDALEAAHQQGVVHRDVKPENVLLQYGDSAVPRVKLVDFGTAKILAESGGVTQMALGSPSYMAPEQFELENIGTWTDVYASAVVAFELFAERKPFPGDDDRAILKNKFDPAFDPFAAVSLAPDVESVLRRALAEEPDYRFRDAGEFREALLQVLDWPGYGLLFDSEPDEGNEVEDTQVAPYESRTKFLTARRRSGRIPTPTPYSLEGGLGRIPALPPASEDSSPSFEFEMYEESGEAFNPMFAVQTTARVERPPECESAKLRALAAVRRVEHSMMGRLIRERPTWRTISLMLAILSLIVVVQWDRGAASTTTQPIRLASPSPVGVAALAASPSTGNEKESKPTKARIPEVPVRSESPIVTNIMTFDNDTCFARDDGTVSCLGESGLLDVATDDAGGRIWHALSSPLVEMDVISDSAGASACALLQDGNVRCWGVNPDGRLGYGHKKPVSFREVTGTSGFVNVPTRRPAVALAMASKPSPTTCVALDDGQIRCWWGARQRGATPPDHIEFSIGASVSQLVATDDEFCARTAVGTVTCWDAQALPAVPRPVSLQRAAVALAAGDSHVCALDGEGTVSCWGDNDRLQLGLPGTGTAEAPIPVPTRGAVRALASGSGHTCALLHEGVIRCWGDNRVGQLGIRTAEPKPFLSSSETDFVALTGVATSVVASGGHACAGMQDERVICWGRRAEHLQGTQRLSGMESDTSFALRFIP